MEGFSDVLWDSSRPLVALLHEEPLRPRQGTFGFFRCTHFPKQEPQKMSAQELMMISDVSDVCRRNRGTNDDLHVKHAKSASLSSLSASSFPLNHKKNLAPHRLPQNKVA